MGGQQKAEGGIVKGWGVCDHDVISVWPNIRFLLLAFTHL